MLIKRVTAALVVLAVNVTLLSVVDLILVKLDLLRPPLQYGLPGVGFGYPGVRQSTDYGAPRVEGERALTIAMVGDSHSQLVFDHPLDSHEFVLEGALRAQGIPATMISAGRGRYSPLQEYLLFKLELKNRYHPRVLLMNFYSGNDFYDMLRPDDRPHFVRDRHNAIVPEKPVWISFVDPDQRSWIQRSRLLWGVDEAMSRLGYPRIVMRLRMLSAAASRPGHSWSDTLSYLEDLRNSQEPRLGYPAAFAAQILNQALFFRHFPESTDESLAYTRYLLQQARAENPGTLFVLSSIPSAALMDAIPNEVRIPWRDTLERTGLTEKWVVALEDSLVDRLASSATEAGWLFVDLRPCLRGSAQSAQLFSSADFHISAVASRLIGRCQAKALLENGGFLNLVRRSPRDLPGAVE